MTAMMNVYQLELFYYVVKHGGISAALRHIPHVIQQPAVSGQMRALESDIGVKLFERRPFCLTTEGSRLFAHVQPFFEGLDEVINRARDAAAPRLRVGASELIIRDHLHPIVAQLRGLPKGTKLALRSGFTNEISQWLHDGEIDLAIAPIEGRPVGRVHCAPILRIPLVLVVPPTSKCASADELWAQRDVTEPLVTMPATEVVTRLFRKGLQRLRVNWPTTIEASSLELVSHYVQRGYGIGVNVALPGIVNDPGVRILPLNGFEPMVVAILWRGEMTAMTQMVLDESRRYVMERWPSWVWRESEKT